MENGIKKIRLVEELIDLIKDNSNVAILGTGWIGRLTFYFIKEFVQKEISCFSEEKIDHEMQKYEMIVIALQEEAGCQQAKIMKEKEKYADSQVFYLSDYVKNEMDNELMINYPDIYENEILITRKRELDENVCYEFSNKIQEFMTQDVCPCFQSIEIETINRCNGKCSFCPINIYDDSRPYTKMKTKLFESIIDQLSMMNYRGRVSLFSNNEPLLDKRIVNFAEYTYEHLPEACKIIYTNGTLLNRDIFKNLVKYLDILCIDVYFDDDIRDVITNELIEVFTLCQASEHLKNTVMIQFISRQAIRNNRGGQSKNRHNVYRVKSPCMLPFIQMIVRPDGKLSLCCNDALGKNTLGDLNSETLIDAWNNHNYRDIREKIAFGRQNVDFCRYCDNYASTNIKGNDFFSKKQLDEAWYKVKEILDSIK